MSYVLDALRKAEKDRRRQPSLGLKDDDQDSWIKPPDTKKRGRFGIGIFIIFGLCCFALVVVLVAQFGAKDLPISGRQAETAEEQTLSVDNLVNINLQETPAASAILDLPDAERIQIEALINNRGGSLAERIQNFRFEGSIHIEGNRSASRVFIDGASYQMGDTLDGDIYLLDIGAQSVTLSDGYEEVIHSLN